MLKKMQATDKVKVFSIVCFSSKAHAILNGKEVKKQHAWYELTF